LGRNSHPMARAGGIQMSQRADTLPEEPGEAATNRPPPGSPAHPRVRRILRGLLVLGLAVLLVAVGVGLDRTGLLPGSPTDPAAESPQYRLIRQAWDLIHEQYVDRASLDDTSLAYAAIGAIADAIGDTGHTSFETPADLAAEQAVLSGQYVGIGVALEPSSGGAVVSRVFPGSPASKAGLEAGDLIVAVNGRDVTALTPTDLIGLIEGPVGSAVTLTVRPTAGGKSREIAITREPVTIPVVEWAMIPGSRIADIRIDQFSSGATTTLITVLKAAETAGASGVVLDLRGNPGGLVSEAIGVTSQFVGSGDVYQTRDASGHQTATPVQPGGAALKTPLVVLVDHGTASSAEIVASAIQDAHRAQIVGEATFGTGTILGQFTLADGSALRIGTVEWLTRAGRSIWHVGLKPDQVVALATGEQPLTPADLQSTSTPLAKLPDTQLRAAGRVLEQ
jgi:carboxyl-terminal processing protease